MDRTDSERAKTLRQKRTRLAEERQRSYRRAKTGPSVIQRLNSTLGTRLTLADFDADGTLPVEVDSPPDIAESSGLVAAYIGEERIQKIVACCDATLSPVSGVIGFDEYSFVGTAPVHSITMLSLLEAARSLHDSVIFCPDGKDSAILIDYYKVAGVPEDSDYSIVVQGQELEAALITCFQRNLQE